MNPEKLESDRTSTESPQTVSDHRDPADAAPASSSPEALVERMVAAGEWPEPDLLEQIIKAGDSAVEPLIKVVRTFPRGWPEEAVLDNAVGLLSAIRSPAAIPELIEVIKRYGSESGAEAAQALGRFGAIAFEPVLEACRDPEITGHSRSYAFGAAIYTAGADSSRRARVADVLRPMLADAIDRFRLALRAQADQLVDKTLEVESEEVPNEDSEVDQEPGFDPAQAEAEGENAIDLHGEIFYLVNDLSALADPKASKLIKTAFDEDMVERLFFNEEAVEARYRQGGDSAQLVPDWLEHYRESYQGHLEDLNPPENQPRRDGEPDRPLHMQIESRPSLMPVEPIRNKVPNLGRNDPCWCGSGKKYKKCHLGKDARS